MENRTEAQDTQSSHPNTIKTIEDEVLKLEKQEADLLTPLHYLQHSIAHGCVLARNVKNSPVPINRLPDEILLACITEAAQDWMSRSDDAEERVIYDHFYNGGSGDFEWSCTPVITISYVSRRWRYLAIHMPALWTNLVITPSSGRHLDVLREFLQRASGMPIIANFRFCGTALHCLADVLLMDVTVLLLRTQQISGLSFLNSDPMLSFRITDQPIHITGPPVTTTFSHLTSLTIFNIDGFEDLTFTSLRSLLSATPHLKSLTFQQYGSVDPAEKGDRTTIDLPKLEILKIIDYSPLACKLLDSLSAPEVRQLELLYWISMKNSGTSSFLFLENNDNFGLKVPKFPKIWNFTLSWYCRYDYLDAKFLSAFPGVTHFMIRSPTLFNDSAEAKSMAPPTFQWLRRLSLDFAFGHIDDMDPRNCFNWLPNPKADDPLLISISDSSDLSTQEACKRADRYLFLHYKELQQHGKLDGSSSRLDKFLCWQADGEPYI
ncbi:hypothetical protein BJ138DRAFT_1129083 [Hygrophoropsis aurantiaca]|uniref:Uncharacterized protein n=1 Tax=Hygrophoropsis aurantiaca TaxID=72124 RepID=A0ACB8A278_9AGAM|nr:hypothetical protein BJ138DRAFT_1129083 [Hygrophoropsis aurantiaca]